MSDRERVVFDTSTLVGAMLRPVSVPRQALFVAVNWYQICVTHASLNELHEVVQRPKFERYLSLSQRLAFVELVSQYSLIVEVDKQSMQASENACRDPKDEQFLALALSIEAVALVSSDNDLLTLHPWKNLAIITPAAFLQLQSFKTQI